MENYEIYQNIHDTILNKINDLSEFEKWTTETSEFSLNNNYFICYNMVDYIASLINKKNEPIYSQCKINDLINLIGFYKCENNNNIENHNFILYITNNTIYLYSTYGGYYHFIHKSFNKKY